MTYDSSVVLCMRMLQASSGSVKL